MTCSLNWYRRNEDGKREQVEFKLVRDKATWTIHRERNEPRELFEPDSDDWDALLDAMERNLRRGKVYPEDLRIARQLRERASK
jgi:hypothetical protein